jgi:hypothetical protein
MKKTIIFAMLIAIMTIASPVSAQTIVKGHVVNEKGETVEYVSICFEEGDSEDQSSNVGTISDAKGNFELEIPANRKNDLVFTHVSFQKAIVPYETYATGQQLTVTMKDKVVELAEVVVGKKNKPQKIVGKAISGPVASFRGKGKIDGAEWGPVFKSKKDYVISDILLTVKGISYQWCVLSFNIYEIQGGKFVNILNKPIYHRIEKSNSKQRLDIQPEETIVLRGKRKYYISVMVVDSDRYGILDMQSQFKTSYARNITKGKKRKLPIGPAIMVQGYEIEH